MKGQIEEKNFYSTALDEEIQLLIYLPPMFSPLYKYNLLITQDGQDYFNLGRISKTTETLLEEKKISNTIIVGVPYKDVNDRKDKYHPNGNKIKNYIRFLAHELIPFLDEQYPTYQMGRTRCLAGDSLGGTVSLLTALSYPNTFGQVIMQSPFVNEMVIEEVKSFSSQQLLEVYHSVGKLETAVKTTDGKVRDFISPNRQLQQLMSKMRFTVVYEEFNGDHTWTYWQPDLKHALQKTFATW